MNKVNVAIVGATGAVGTKILEKLLERNFPVESIKLLASKRSAGTEITAGGHKYIVEETVPESFDGIDIAFFSAGGSISEKFAHEAVKRGAVVIDNTSAFRMIEEIPLVVPEVNAGSFKRSYRNHRQSELFDNSNGDGASANSRKVWT